MYDPVISKNISYYNITKLLGEGGMGSVYLAEDTMLDRKVAIKILNPVLTKDPMFIQRFRQEAKVQSTLHHPKIITLYTFFEEFGNYCMVMEYAEGETLKDLIRRIGPIPENRVKNIFIQLIEGLEFAHNKGVIHRDIKPGNIMIDKDDNMKIMDFGIAKIMGDMNLTKTGMKMGTIYYMSPEQVRADKDIDFKTDIFSAGITLYEMLTGKLPYNTTTESDYEIMKEIVENVIKDPREQYPFISESWIDIILLMTKKNKNERYVNFTEEFNDNITELKYEEITSDKVYGNDIFYCGTCNNEVSRESKYCQHCGDEFEEDEVEETDMEVYNTNTQNLNYLMFILGFFLFIIILIQIIK